MDLKTENHKCAAKVRRLFDAFSRESVHSCVWKSSDRWEEGTTGKTDIDLLVDKSQFTKAIDCLVCEGWLLIEAESWRTFSDILDFITFENGECLHVHLHSKIVSGEKMVKSLRPPLTNLYLRRTPVNSYPPFVEPELEFILLMVRITLKISFIDIAGALKRRSRIAVYRNYIEEYDVLRRQCNRLKISKLLDEPELRCLPSKVILAAFDNLDYFNFSERRAIRKSIVGWRPLSWWSVYVGTPWRKFLKYRDGHGKHLPFSGFSIAVCGPDGSGKTTLVGALNKKIASQMQVQRFYMGGNMRQPGRLRGAVMRTLWVPYLLMRKTFKITRWKWAVNHVELLYTGLDAFLMRAEKMRRLASACEASSRGEIVLFERYPLFYPYGDDMQKTVHTDGDTQQRKPDLLVLLDIDENIAFSRRPSDNRNILKSKIAAFRLFKKSLEGLEGEVIVLNAQVPVAVNVEVILEHLSERLSTKMQAFRFGVIKL